MAGDNRYYKRHNFQSILMEDYEVRDVINRSSTPNLELTIQIEGIQLRSEARIPVPQTSRSPPPTSACLDVSVSVINHAPTAADYAVFQLFVTHGITVSNPGRFARSSQPSFKSVQIGSVKGFIKGGNLSLNYAIPGNITIGSGPWSIPSVEYAIIGTVVEKNFGSS